MSAIQDYLTGPDDPTALARAAEVAVRCGGVHRMQATLYDSLACEDVRPRLPELAEAQDLGLPLPAEMQILARHLAHCRACAAELAELQTLSRQAEAELIVPAPLPLPISHFCDRRPRWWPCSGSRPLGADRCDHPPFHGRDPHRYESHRRTVHRAARGSASAARSCPDLARHVGRCSLPNGCLCLLHPAIFSSSYPSAQAPNLCR